MSRVTTYDKVKNALLGRPLENDRLAEEKLGWFWGLPIMASDAVSSVAYAIEEILIVLVPMLGIISLRFLGPIAIPIILLLIVLAFSYVQIINHYPSGGGAYNVASDNFGKGPALVAAASLVIDYILTVAVSISSATAALIAAFPILLSLRVPIALLGIAIVTLLNLRGAREASKVFGVPTYAFIVIMATMIITGLVELAAGKLHPLTYSNVPAQTMEPMLSFVFVLLLLRAFSSGCTALTGIEAVSNSMPSFKEPRQRNAKIVLYALATIVLFIFGGSVILAQTLQVIPIEGKTVISQMGAAVFGSGSPLFYVLQFATAFILFLAANTAYTDLPNLLAILAHDGFMPRQFMQRGSKLSLSNGIMLIMVVASLLVIIFRAEVHYLIPLYSVGVFLSFTISQAGMTRKWIRDKEPHWREKMLINVLGATMTLVGLLIVFVMKFTHGAWMLAIAIPLLIFLMWRVHHHYEVVRESVFISKEEFQARYRKSETSDNFLCIVPVAGIDRSSLKMLNYANKLSSNVVALNIATERERADLLEKKWAEYEIDDPLWVVMNQYRNIIPPVEDFIEEREADLKSGEVMAIVLTKFVVKNWYDQVLHNQSTFMLIRALQNHRNISILLVPYHYSDK
ncbi:MAG: APC family permease [Coriobacteriia bacterium]|nr:APC family permease [Coriobacteriia bacterium]